MLWNLNKKRGGLVGCGDKSAGVQVNELDPASGSVFLLGVGY
jgi:hypothetical protein